ncbi:hypothetical protein E2C01_017488 [Portunus trituberculatus]|uniref:Uncharacterized protein n=1 Tax=Portunus trituberculatus TaxID=210409 RepID=A0A5B7DTL0_PORTR|nr:hypothetical protein [Portunus trituberculatus]
MARWDAAGGSKRTQGVLFKVQRTGLECWRATAADPLPATLQVGVVDAAYHYICQLQSALLAKFSARGVPADLAGVVGGKVSTASDVRALAIHLIHSTNMAPSFMTPSASRGFSPFRHTSSASSQSTSSLSSRISTSQHLARKSNFKK